MTPEQFQRSKEFFADDPRFPYQVDFPRLDEDGGEYAFICDSHYVLHTAWAARVLAEIKPEKLVDFAGYVYFVGILSAFIPIEFYDIRAASLPLSNVTTGAADLVKLPFADNSIKALSCLHVLEHVGLGRYGDTLDKEGDIKASHELQRILAPGGDLLIVVPSGAPKLMFNAHRIYSYEQVVNMYPDLYVHEFALITDDRYGTNLIRNASIDLVKEQEYGCGCFWFKKKEVTKVQHELSNHSSPRQVPRDIQRFQRVR